MFRKMLLILAIPLALGTVAHSGTAVAHDSGGGFGGRGGGGFHDGGGFNDAWSPSSHADWGRDGWGSRDRLPFAFFPSYLDDNDQCYQPQRVMTPTGWHWREVWVCD
jgi:hypothetical protein